MVNAFKVHDILPFNKDGDISGWAVQIPIIIRMIYLSGIQIKNLINWPRVQENNEPYYIDYHPIAPIFIYLARTHW